jgi:hypothetical protein
MREKGISPPPRVDEGVSALAGVGLTALRAYLLELDKWSQRLQAAFARTQTYEATLNPANVGANTTSAQTFSVPGLSVHDIVIVNKPSHTAGLGIVNARVSAADTLELTFMNTTGAGIDPGSETYTIVSIRR